MLMDGGSAINILYASMLKEMGISKSKLSVSHKHFHGVISRMKAKSLGQISQVFVFHDKIFFPK